MVPSNPTTDDPMQYLLSDDSDKDTTEVRQVRVHDRGSKSQCIRVVVQGVPMYGIVDIAADITIMGGNAFKQVAAAAKLRKKNFLRPSPTRWVIPEELVSRTLAKVLSSVS